MTGELEPTLSWQEREIIAALRRLANARANLGTLERQAGGPPLDAGDVAVLEALAAEQADLRPKAEGRFGGSTARTRIAEIEGEMRLVLDRLGVGDLDVVRQRTAARDSRDAVDVTMLEFARRERDDAIRAWHEIRDLELPPVEDDPDAGTPLGDAAGDDEGGQVVPFDRRSVS